VATGTVPVALGQGLGVERWLATAWGLAAPRVSAKPYQANSQ
jgi:hypothetical protein